MHRIAAMSRCNSDLWFSLGRSIRREDTLFEERRRGRCAECAHHVGHNAIGAPLRLARDCAPLDFLAKALYAVANKVRTLLNSFQVISFTQPGYAWRHTRNNAHPSSLTQSRLPAARTATSYSLYASLLPLSAATSASCGRFISAIFIEPVSTHNDCHPGLVVHRRRSLPPASVSFRRGTRFLGLDALANE